MAKLDYASVDILLVDWDLNTRQSCKNILYNSGFREVNLGSTMAEVEDILSKHLPDLLICSCDLKDGDFLGYVRLIRQGKAANNPFLPIITLVDEPTPELVARIVESGTDTVIAKPISTNQLLDRIHDLIDARKEFIVADDYVGPIRRKDGSRTSMEVPNTLRSRVNGEKISFSELENAIAIAQSQMKMLNIDVIGIQIAAHVTNLVPMLERGGRLDPSIRNELLGLLDVTDGAGNQLSGSAYEHAISLCASIGDVASSILSARSGNPDPRDVKLLKPLSQAIQACFSGAISNAQQVEAIVQQIGVKQA